MHCLGGIRERLSSAVVTVALVCALAGCGAYTKRDFVAQANAICASAVRQARAVIPRQTSGSTVGTAAVDRYLLRADAILESEARGLRSLRRPAQTEGQRGELRAYLDALTLVVADYGQLAAAARRRDGKAINRLESALQATGLDALAARYGLNACALPSGTSE